MSKNHSKLDVKDLFIKALDLDLIDMNPIHIENRPLPKSPIINNFFISKKDYLDAKTNSIENKFITRQRRLIKSNSYNLYNSFKNDINVSFGDIIKIGDKNFLVESYNPYNKLYKLRNLVTFSYHYFNLSSMRHYVMLTHDIKFDLETFEKNQLKKVKNISKNLCKRRELIKEKIKKYEYTLLDTNSDSEYSSDWEDDISLPPLEDEDDDFFDFGKDFVYNPLKPKLDFKENLLDNLEKGKLEKNKIAKDINPFDMAFNKLSVSQVDSIDNIKKEETISDKNYSYITNKETNLNIFDNNQDLSGYNNLWNFNNKVNIENDNIDEKIVFTIPINLFNTPIVNEYKPKNNKPKVDILTPIINFIQEKSEPKAYEKNLIKDIKPESIPTAYNNLINKDKLAPIYNIDNNYFNMLNKTENIKNLELLPKIEPKIVTCNTESIEISNVEEKSTNDKNIVDEPETPKDSEIKTNIDNTQKNNLVLEEESSWTNYCSVM